MNARLAAIVLALVGLPAAALPGYFNVDATEPKESPLVPAKATATCSLWARYDPDHVVWQEQHFLGGFTQCGSFQGFYSAASAAAVGLPTWQSYGFEKDSSGPSGPYAGWPYQCSVNIDFEPATPSTVQITFTGAAACTAQRSRILAVVKGSMGCNVLAQPCPWSRP